MPASNDDDVDTSWDDRLLPLLTDEWQSADVLAARLHAKHFTVLARLKDMMRRNLVERRIVQDFRTLLFAEGVEDAPYLVAESGLGGYPSLQMAPSGRRLASQNRLSGCSRGFSRSQTSALRCFRRRESCCRDRRRKASHMQTCDASWRNLWVPK